MGPRGSHSTHGLCILVGGQMSNPQGLRFFHYQAKGRFVFSLLARQLVIPRHSSAQIPPPLCSFPYPPFHHSGLLGWHMEPNICGVPIVAKSPGAPVHATGVVIFVSYSCDSRKMGVGGRTSSSLGCLPKAT